MAAPTSVHQAAVEVEPWLQRLARLGYVAKGVIYLLIGAFAFMAAIGYGGKKTNQAGAINSIRDLPFGNVLLIGLGVGLAGYAVWRLVEAAGDPEGKGTLKRIGYVISALAYGGFGYAALSVAFTGDEARSQPQQSAARLFGLPFGAQLGMALAAGFVVGAFVQIANGLGGKFLKALKREEMSEDQFSLARWTGGIGLIARGALFGLIGWLLWRASSDHNAGEAGGIDRALTTVAQAPFGSFLLAMMGVGLVCYGIYMWVEARFRRMTPVAGLKGSTH
ncbi:DUF1206 domain-containing protein [Fimbriimonas ginsengisoli]|uniref:DUF1206 domain-containing protein n=1 Tax=Fimbriimonas ginsengisoli Gsoil 348 TaxID=661478 RepID=A0A068NMV3_FIMGI|nr:DUF1206 domain-containing protein [Fimbriimonas ginsengisoli]AIE84732.1 hypothetical protein OP10G_1364 [Fimbriimonas ginsengisoli Gsoil 348]